MKKLLKLLPVLILVTWFFLSASPALAQCPNTGWAAIIGCVNNPNNIPGSNADEQISNFISVIIRLIFIAGAIVFVFLIVIGAFSWMTSGGEKEALAKARSRIVHAIIGLTILSLAFVIINLIAHITNIGILANPVAPQVVPYGIQPPPPPRVPPIRPGQPF